MGEFSQSILNIMNLKKTLNALFLLIPLFLNACDEGDDKTAVFPTNLTLTVEINPDDVAEVTVTATAENAEFYNLYFGDVAAETPLKSLDGVETHTYESSGTYVVKVTAHSTEENFISASKQITITIPPPEEEFFSPLTREGYTLIWQDEFDGASLNTSFWNYEIGTGSNGWGNNELQYYREENTSVADGNLIITAKKETFEGRNYTSSRLTTKDKKEFTYGWIDIRAKVPKGQGIWPALWMLGDNISTVGWPACGELDIMEMIGGSNREKTVHGTIHWADGSNQHAQYGGSKTLSSGMYSDKFHVYSVEWNESYIKWYIDDVFYHQIDITPGHLSEMHAPQFFIFNVAVGGNWPGNPDASTVFPQQMLVDYIRVFQE
jgi:beta-glucanase (GH16 family)